MTARAFLALGQLKHGQLNKTEAAYAALLDERKLAGDVEWWAFEKIKIRLADNTFYTPDFFVMRKGGALEVHEVKGGFTTEGGRLRVKFAAETFPAQFYLCKKIGKAWSVEAL